MDKKTLKTLKKLTCGEIAREVQYAVQELNYDVTLHEAESLWREFSATKDLGYWNAYHLSPAIEEFQKWLREEDI